MINSILYVICFFILVVLLHFNMSRYLHILQQSFYHTSDFLNNVKASKSYRIKIYDVVLFILSVVSIFTEKKYINYILIFFSIIFLVLAIMNTKKNKIKEKKKFKVTNRVKIIYTFCYCILLFLLLLTFVINIRYVICILSLYSVSSLVIVAISNTLSLPLVYILNYRYIKEAKNILKEHKDLKIIGITGSYGKTSTKNIIYSVLREKYSTVMTPKSYNTTLGVTKTIRENIKPYTEVFVCEMGASRLGDIKEICEIVKPDISIITSIGVQHLSSFKKIENIVKEKFKIVEMAKNGAMAILNMDSDNIKNNYLKYVKDKNVAKYGLDKMQENYARNITINENGSVFDAVVDGETIKIETMLLGKHNIYNILCAIIVAKKLGMTNDEIKRAIKTIKPIEHRLELKYMNNILVLDDSFNSNPEGSKMAIECLTSFKKNYKVLVTPGMVELGEEEERLNRNLGKYASSCDFVILEKSNVSKYVKEGLESKNYKNYVLVEDIYEAFELLNDMNKKHKDLIALIENDLPDCYM